LIAGIDTQSMDGGTSIVDVEPLTDDEALEDALKEPLAMLGLSLLEPPSKLTWYHERARKQIVAIKNIRSSCLEQKQSNMVRVVSIAARLIFITVSSPHATPGEHAIASSKLVREHDAKGASRLWTAEMAR
jgi:hypothetical protein